MVKTSRKKTAKPLSGNIVNQSELARMFGVGRDKVNGFINHGMPIYDNKGRQKAKRFDSAVCINWYSSFEVSLATGDQEHLSFDEIKRRKELTELKLREIELMKQQERFGDIDLVLEDFSDALAIVRSRIMAIKNIAPQLEHLDQGEIEKKLETELTTALEELSDFDGGDDAD